MTTGIWAILGIVILSTLAYLRISLSAAAVIVTVLTVVAATLLSVPVLILVLAWLVSAALIALSITSLRRSFISNRILPVLRSAMPAMSQTEREALEAGTVWWDAELFSGRPNWRKLLDTPEPRLSAEEQA